jgi:SAM-dependent methyltransferase
MKSDSVFIYIFLLLFICFAIRYIVSIYIDPIEKEGFIQKETFVLKIDQDIYDTFYTSVYDDIFIPLPRVENVITILQKTEPYKENSIFLDIGSGTGMLVNALSENGYNAFGIDKSEPMIEYAEKKYPLSTFIEGDVRIPMQFESNTFTHICCVDFTIYLFMDKSEIFRNMYSWVTNGGYIILHLVNPDTFDTVIPAGKPFLIDDLQKYIPTQKRILKTAVEFEDYHYKSEYVIHSHNVWKHIEMFIDKKTKHVRQNERNLFMDTVENILFIAEKHRFKKIDLYSDKEYYVLKKI